MDHAATTNMYEEVYHAMIPFLTTQYGNPSTVTSLGVQAKVALTQARESIAHLLCCDPGEVYFTSGATESNNWVLRTIGLTDPAKKHIITSSIEHPSVLNTCKALEKQGYSVTYLPVDEKGIVDPNDVEQAIRKDTAIISVMTANNEIGTIQPIAEIGKIAQNANIPFHTDAVQGIAHVPMNVQSMGLDYLSASAHKIGGPKGVGFLYMKKGKALPPLLTGGSQESNRRAGTENVAGIVGMHKAIDLLSEYREEFNQKERIVRDHMMKRLEQEIPGCTVNGSKETRLPNNVHVLIPQMEAQQLVLRLNEKGIYAGFGSACSSNEQTSSHVLKAIGRSHRESFYGVRFTFGELITIEDADIVVDTIKTIVLE